MSLVFDCARLCICGLSVKLKETEMVCQREKKKTGKCLTGCKLGVEEFLRAYTNVCNISFCSAEEALK